jgi:hypothetical protein
MKMPLPDKIANKPTIKIGLDLYWKAFQDLSSDRDIGMGVGPIPWSSIHEWGRRNHIYGDDFERLVQVIRGLDAVFMEKQGKKVKGKMGGNREFISTKQKKAMWSK